MTEVEIRGKLSKADLERLFAFLEKNGKIKNHYHRLSVDISSGFNEASGKWDYSSPNLLAKELNLKPCTKDEYQKAIEWENQNIHQVYKKEVVEKLLKTIF